MSKNSHFRSKNGRFVNKWLALSTVLISPLGLLITADRIMRKD